MSSNIPASPAYGVYISQLIRYARCCAHYNDFAARHKTLVARLLSQGYKKNFLSNTFRSFTTDTATSLGNTESIYRIFYKRLAFLSQSKTNYTWICENLGKVVLGCVCFNIFLWLLVWGGGCLYRGRLCLPYPEHLAMPSLDHDGPLQTDNTFVYYYLLLLYFTGIVNLALHLLDVILFFV